MKKLLFILALLFALTTPLAAIEPPISGNIVAFTDYTGDCGQTQANGNQTGVIVDVDLNMTGIDIETTPPTYEDVFEVIIKDGNNQVISSTLGTVPIGTQQTTQVLAAVNPYLAGGPSYYLAGSVAPTARPWTLYVRDRIYAVNGVGQEINLLTFDPAAYSASCASLPLITSATSDALNSGINDLDVQMFNGTDDDGNPTLQIYALNDEGDGTLALEITQDIIAQYIDNPPSENTALLTSADGKVTLYILDTGELQINSGPDDEGKIHVLIFDGIPPTNIYGYVIDPPLFQ